MKYPQEEGITSGPHGVHTPMGVTQRCQVRHRRIAGLKVANSRFPSSVQLCRVSPHRVEAPTRLGRVSDLRSHSIFSDSDSGLKGQVRKLLLGSRAPPIETGSWSLDRYIVLRSGWTRRSQSTSASPLASGRAASVKSRGLPDRLRRTMHNASAAEFATRTLHPRLCTASTTAVLHAVFAATIKTAGLSGGRERAVRPLPFDAALI